MAKKKGKKKTILKRIAAKRGERSRKKRETKVKDKGSTSGKSREIREQAEKAYRDSALLAEMEEFSTLHIDGDLLTQYLEDAKKRGMSEPNLFLQEGIDHVMTVSFLEKVKEFLNAYHEKSMTSAKNEDRAKAVTARFVLGWLEQGLPPSEIPFFFTLFLRDVKNHPLADTGQIWKLIRPFLPPRIVAPDRRIQSDAPSILASSPGPAPSKEEKKEEKRDKRYPHIILPR